MAAITRRNNGTYRVQVRRRGKSLSATFAKRIDAVEWGKKTEAALIEKRHFPERSRHTVGEAIDRYSKEVLPYLKPGTSARYSSVLCWWKKKLGDVTLTDLTASDILEIRSESSYAPATLNVYKSVLSSVLNSCVRKWDWLNHSPMHKITKLREPQGRTRYLTEDELARLLDACKRSRTPYLHTAVVTAITTGGRYLELLGLRWADVDFRRGTFTFWQTKNGDTRVVPMSEWTRKVLIEHERVYGTGVKVFPTTTLWRCWKTARKRARLHDFKFHDLRHTFASYLAMSGASLVEIGELLGHRRSESTKRYTHLSEPHTQEVVNRMVNKLLHIPIP